jgi:peptidoglycan-associated lipoprotein
MNRNSLRLGLLVSLGLVIAACAPTTTDVAVAPPPATARPETPATTAPTTPVADAESGAVPGSQEDLRQKAGSDTVLFAYDSYELDAEARGVLARHAEWLRANPSVRVTLEGHCDERGTREYNLALGERRANSAKNFLAAQGIAVDRLSTISYGKERPAVEGSDEGAFAQNRRAVTVVMGP